jgi:predicted acyl esterase
VNIRTEFPRRIRLISEAWIPLSDGTRLSARIWLPVDAETNPVPAVLEYLPYRKDDATAPRDAIRHPYFAGFGYASVRVDMRGSGDSDGMPMDEYVEQEQDDALEVLAWLAAQPWCTGKVGMIGLSWGGFNGLQVAMRGPPELAAVISLGTTHDRYLDDIHYTGGCVYRPMLGWATTMLAYSGRPPDPRIAGATWRETWLARMREAPKFIDNWLSHQRYDSYWKHGSVREDWGAIRCPVYVVSGWADWYRNPVLALLEGLRVPRKGLIGPWGHVYPEEGVPGPAIGFAEECVRWWDQWLKGIDTGIADEPMLRFWMPEPLGPGSHDLSPGRWVAEPSWPSTGVVSHRLALTAEGLRAETGEERALEIRGMLDGADSSGWVSAPDQREEDLRWLCFDSEPATAEVEIFGNPYVTLTFASNRRTALVAARLCDVAPDGTSTLITRGILNLTHRFGHERAEPLQRGTRTAARIRLDVGVRALRPGHRFRLALSPTYWPRAWPSPEQVTLTVFAGPDSWLELPVRRRRPEDAQLPPFGEAEGAPPLEVERVEAPVQAGEDAAGARPGRTVGLRFSDGLVYASRSSGTTTIEDDDPLSARITSEQVIEIGRGDWQTRVVARAAMTADAEAFHVESSLEGFESGRPVFERSWTSTIPRDLV